MQYYMLQCFVLLMAVVVCQDGDIRVQGGMNEREGRVEICSTQAWGTVCDDFWDNTDAGVACLQLGYSSVGQLFFILYNS